MWLHVVAHYRTNANKLASSECRSPQKKSCYKTISHIAELREVTNLAKLSPKGTGATNAIKMASLTGVPSGLAQLHAKHD